MTTDFAQIITGLSGVLVGVISALSARSIATRTSRAQEKKDDATANAAIYSDANKTALEWAKLYEGVTRQYNGVQAQYNEAEARINRLADKIDDLEKEIKRVESEKTSCVEALAQARAEIIALRNREQAYIRQIEEFKKGEMRG